MSSISSMTRHVLSRSVPFLAILLSACAQWSGTVPASTTAGSAAPAPVRSVEAFPDKSAVTPSTRAGVTAIAASGTTQTDDLPPMRPTAHTDLWERIRAGFAIPDLIDSSVQDKERFYATKPEYFQRMTGRGSRYLYHIVEELESRNMPTELALLPFIESAFNPEAVSSAKAAGMWQFMSATGKSFDLRQNLFRDDRRDVLASTRAALDYLQMLHRMFGDWHLALAAYNWGQGSVLRAQKRNMAAGKPTDYLQLKMPAETRQYVPKFQAVKNLIRSPKAFGLTLPELANHPYFKSVAIDRDIDVALAASLAGLPLAEFKALNPQMNKPVILAAGTPHILLPYDKAERFEQQMARHQGPLASWTAWTAPRQLKVAEAANLLGMQDHDLREINRIPPKMLIKAGSTILVPRAEHVTQDVSSHVADNATLLLTPDGPSIQRIQITVGRSATLASLAKTHRVKAADLARWNGLTLKAKLKTGQKLVLLKPQRGLVTAASELESPAGAAQKKAKTSRSSTQKSTQAKSKAKAGSSSLASKKAQAKPAKKSAARPKPAKKVATSKERPRS